MHGDEPIVVENENGSNSLNIETPKIIQEPMIQTVVDELLSKGKCLCHGSDALETYRIMDIVLEEYYSGRSDNFWEREKLNPFLSSSGFFPLFFEVKNINAKTAAVLRTKTTIAAIPIIPA